jgi:predicted AAA+ superfamily ATPase
MRADALRWALDRSSRSGRTASQFVADLAGRLALEKSR